MTHASSTKVNSLIQKIKHYLITNFGKVEDKASLEEYYFAFIYSLREEIMVNWTATLQTMEEKKPRILYYLSMEYLPGRYLANNITNIGATSFIKEVVEKMNRNYLDLINCEKDPGLGNGGLGRLVSCFLDSLSTLNYPYFAYGLRYQYGIFDQEIWDGKQIETPDRWLLNQNPWEFRKDTEATYVHFCGKPIPAKNTHGEVADLLDDYEEVRSLPYDTPIIGYASQGNFSVGTLRLFSTKESPRNFELQKYNAGLIDQAGENTSLTDLLYPNDHHETGKRIRLKQEFLLVASAIQDIISRHLRVYPDLNNFADKVRIQINDTHPALVIVELMRSLLKNHDFTFEDAWETTKSCCSYTNHTILSEALEEWNEKRVEYLLPRQYDLIKEINKRFCSQVQEKYQDEQKVNRMSLIQGGQIRMANLCILGSSKVNGVAHLHTEILKTIVFKDFYEMFPEKFVNVTNGVTQRRWLLYCNPLLSQLITDCIGDSWITNFPQIEKLKEFASKADIQNRFLEIKKENKKALFDFLIKTVPIRNDKGKILSHSPILTPDALVDMQIKRIHEYKRPLLNALNLIMIYFELKKDPNARKIKRMAIIGGKAAPGYDMAKKIIRLICCIERKINNDPDVNEKLKLVFVENYNVSKAEVLIPAADLSQQISTAGMEASGTGNMKLSMNGALTLGTDDGANIEMRKAVTDTWWPFLFGSSAEELQTCKKNHSYHPLDIYIQDPFIKQALDSLKDKTFAKNDQEHQDFCDIYRSLLEGPYDNSVDPFFVLKDLKDYYTTQKKVEALFLTPLKWAEYALHNVASMGSFSTDISIKTYVENIWHLEKCPPSEKTLENVRLQYWDHDRCRVIEN